MTNYPSTIPVCQIDENNYFVGMTTADLDPLEEQQRYLIPRLCVQADEPAHRTGFVSQWNNGKWDYVEDHRGESVYLKKQGKSRQ